MARDRLAALEAPARSSGRWVRRAALIAVFALIGLAVAEAWLLLHPARYQARAKLLATAEITGAIGSATGASAAAGAVLADDAFAEALIDRFDLLTVPGFGAPPSRLEALIVAMLEQSGARDALGIDLSRTKAAFQSDPRERARKAIEEGIWLESGSSQPVRLVAAEARDPLLAARIANEAARLIVEATSTTAPPDGGIPDSEPAGEPPASVVVEIPEDPLPPPNSDGDAVGAGGTDDLGALEAELDLRRQGLRQAEAAVDDFLARSGAPSAELLGARRMRLEAMAAKLATVSDERNRLNARLRALRSLRGGAGDLAAAAEIIRAPSMNAVRTDLLAARQTVETLSESLGAQHPTLLAARELLAETETRFNVEADRVIESLRADLTVQVRRAEELNREIAALSQSIEDTQTAFAELRRLDREAAEAQRDYDAVASKIAAARTAAALAASRSDTPPPRQGPRRLVVQLPPQTAASAPEDNREPAAAFQLLELAAGAQHAGGPTATLVRAAGAGSGAALALLLIGIAGWRDDWLRSVGAIEAATTLPVLAVVPASREVAGKKPKRGLLSRWNKRWSAQAQTPSERLEAIVDVSDALRAGAPDARSVGLAVFSLADARVRSSFVVDLAIAAAADGLEVAVIDCDNRNRFVTQSLGAQRAGDMTDLILGRNGEGQPTGETTVAGLSLFTFGSLANLALKRLNRETVEAALAARMSGSGLLLYDVPRPDRHPTARGIARIAETSIILAEAGHVRRRDISTLIYHLRKAGADIAGIVLVERS